MFRSWIVMLICAGKIHAQNPVERNHRSNQNQQNLVHVNNAIGSILAPPSRWPLDIFVMKRDLFPSVNSLRSRLRSSIDQSEFFEPITLRVNSKDALSISQFLGQENTEKHIASQVLPRVLDNRLNLTAEDLKWLDLEKLQKVLKQESIDAFLDSKTLRIWLGNHDRAKELRNHFLGQYQHIIYQKLLELVRKNNSDIPVSDLLPSHTQKLLGLYSSARGRNCFGTALYFADPKVYQDPQINFVREASHHWTMINNDEFSHALWLGYSELKPHEILDGLRYGDVVAFYDSAEGNHYRALKHAAVHLFGNVYFHKPSKSASSPIELTTWDSMVNVWRRLSKDLDYKVFRKLPMNRYHTQESMLEKIVWSK